MGEDVNVNPDGLLSTAAHLDESASRMRAHHEAARSRGSIGHGAIGELFQGMVRRAEKVVEDVTETVVKAYEDSSKGLRKVAQRTLEDDAKAKSTFDGMGRRTEGLHGHPGAAVGGGPARGSSDGTDPTLFHRGGKGSRGPTLPMNLGTVQDVARRYGVDIHDVDLRIRSSHIGYEGVTGPDGTVHLTRDAFRDEETLARTLYHERFHVDQLRRGLPYPRTDADAFPYEQAAYGAEEQWWASHPLNPANQEGS